MKIPDFVLRFLGRRIANAAKLEDAMDGSKPWWKSSTIWSDIVTIAISIVVFIDKDFGTNIATNHWYQGVIAVLSGIGIYGRTKADTKIQ